MPQPSFGASMKRDYAKSVKRLMQLSPVVIVASILIRYPPQLPVRSAKHKNQEGLQNLYPLTSRKASNKTCA